MSVCIEFKDVSYAYPLTKKAAVKHLNCKLESGKCYGVVGPNAGGKTTFCNLMRGLCPNFYHGTIKGDVVVNGKKVVEWDDCQLSVQIGYVFQDPFAQVSGIKDTVFEEIGIGLENLAVPREDMFDRIMAAAREVSVESLIQKHPLALSGGQCQRVAFASVLVLNSDIIVIDEPTSQLDPEGTEDVFKIIQKLKEQGKTVIISEHKIDLLAQYCDEIIAMSEGKIIAKGPTREVLSNPVLAEYGVAVPQVIDLFMKMQAAGKPMKTVPINLEEAIGQLCARREEMA